MNVQCSAHVPQGAEVISFASNVNIFNVFRKQFCSGLRRRGVLVLINSSAQPPARPIHSQELLISDARDDVTISPQQPLGKLKCRYLRCSCWSKHWPQRFSSRCEAFHIDRHHHLFRPPAGPLHVVMGSPDSRLTRATRDWCRTLPKAELHAHLSGSIRNDAIRKLINRPGNEAVKRRAEGLLKVGARRTLTQCFELFPIIHELITDAETLHGLVIEVLEDYAKDSTVYLELRTTPRASQFFKAEDYLWTVLKAVHEYHENNADALVCRILVSISRHLPVEDARKTVVITRDIIAKTAGTEMRGLIVGLEFSGNPNKGLWSDFEPILREARTSLQLPVSLHFAEVQNDEEARAMLDFKPDRIGHAVVMSDDITSRLVREERSLGVEVCITSNLMTESANGVLDHPVVQSFIPAGHPFCLCTDDCGVFDTTLSNEYGLLVETVELSREQVTELARGGLKLWFCEDENVRKRVYELFDQKLRRGSLGIDKP